MLFNYLNNLKIRNKLIVLLIVPILTILYFSLSGIYLKYQEQQSANSLKAFISVSLRLHNLIYELQNERGLTAGLVNSTDEKGRQNLLLQKQKTDEQLNRFLSELNYKDPDKKYWGLPSVFDKLQQSLQKLSDIRNNVNNSNSDEVFGWYSDVISLGVSITEHIQFVSNDIALVRKGKAYTSLLILEELSAQERGLIYAVFTSSNLNAERIKKISSFVSGQENMLKQFYSVATVEQKLLLQEKMKHPAAVEVEKLRIAVLHKASRNDRLNSLQSLIGYGGLIHDFKNYVLRGQRRYTDSFNDTYIDGINLITEYQKLPGMSNNEIAALNTIKQTFVQYKSMLEMVRSLRAQGKSLLEIDAAVKIDDNPALNAINYLHKSVTGIDTSKWWNKASIRINLIIEVNDVVRKDIIEHSNYILSVATKTLYIYILLTLTSLLISFILGYQIIRRLVGGILDIESHMTRMSTYGEFDNLLAVNGNDEICKVAESFNKLIKERSKYEAQLRLAAMVFDKTSEAMIVTDADNQFISVNPAFTKITGYNIDDVKSSTPRILKSDIHDEPFYHELWNSLLQKGYWSGEIVNRRKNGDVFTEWLNINVIKDSEGKVIRHIAMFNDITERKEMEDEIHSSEQHLKLYREQAPMATIEWNTDFQVLDWNKEAEKMFGYTVDEVKGKNFIDIMLPENAVVDVKQIWSDLMAQTGGQLSINENLTKDGRIIICEWHNTVLIDEMGKVIGAASIIQDITERKKQEEQIRRSQKMDALGKLTGGIAHDYNNMLGVVLGYAELLEANLADQPKLARYIEQIQHAANRGAKLTSKLLTFSSNTSTDLKELNINMLLHEAKLMLEKTLTVRIKLVLDLDEDLYTVILDENEFEDVILNMCINAMHAIDGNGKLMIQTKNVKINQNDEFRLNLHQGDYILLSITDTGNGMSMETKEKLFDPFYSTKGDKGTGLGLSQVYGFVTGSGGAIEVESEIGKGAQFKLYFPKFVGGENKHKQVEIHNNINLRGTETVLIVDDEPALLTMCADMLSGYGYNVLCADSAKKGLDIIESQQIDLLLSDVVMPEMDGYELAEIVLKKYPNIKIQMVSGYTDIHHLKIIDKSLHKNLLFKPYHATELLKKIRQILD